MFLFLSLPWSRHRTHSSKLASGGAITCFACRFDVSLFSLSKLIFCCSIHLTPPPVRPKGSNDGDVWDSLAEHEDDDSLMEVPHRASWAIAGSYHSKRSFFFFFLVIERRENALRHHP
jgi:hypothetical protein